MARHSGPGDTLAQDPKLPPVAVAEAQLEREDRRWTPAKIALWVLIALLGGVAWVVIAFVRGETVNAIWFVFAAVCTYLHRLPFLLEIHRKISASAQ
ncbi:carbon starvation protein A [Renibacterium salmoninarum ATCC 33209]|uniref:Carbon starvation protein A n=1 Tax=Renibacterium salmoninarum (strain ATCC 33209 / DSM 20767 / JCM 11484 / NBRC 15589 / NCIMB 2235) TaxID=288705 RepID=A9WKX0_RENSM|nr:carbon starvation protein A [Renibacterium salmoninarum ATCC 33209]